MTTIRGYTIFALQTIIQPLEFEKLASECMYNLGFSNIDSRGGVKDGGIDAISPIYGGEGKLFHYSTRKDWEQKLLEDIQKDVKNNVPATYEIIFCTNRVAIGTSKDRIPFDLRQKYGFDVRIFDVNNFQLWLDNADWGHDIKNRYGIGLPDEEYETKMCSFCRGNGQYGPGGEIECYVCQGLGQIKIRKPNQMCTRCNGNGFTGFPPPPQVLPSNPLLNLGIIKLNIAPTICNVCNGKGWIEK